VRTILKNIDYFPKFTQRIEIFLKMYYHISERKMQYKEVNYA